ncbi:hypothetical protein ACFPYI_03545 [Halomarina salina]|uniref:DUF4440 domain-containing protein n=1 Tax=Halomarina salina TaxID=1872699 RepID=A0ABD5RJ10_9EURY|nr:hypothetical protein [Halomarina salina]
MDDPTPPDDLPEAVASTLQSLDGHDLRGAVVYAQELLRARHEPLPTVEPRTDEEVVRVEERDGYLVVHKRQRDAAGDFGDVYVYHVSTERHPDGSVHHHWSLIGREE